MRRAWRARDFALALPALLLAGMGEVLLFDEGSRTWGAVLLGVSVLLGAVAWSGTLYRPVPVAGPEEAGAGLGRRDLRLRLGGIATALILWGGGMLAWFAEPGAVFGLQGVLWLASMAVFALSCYRWHPPGDLAARAGSYSTAWTRHERLVFGGLTVLALCTYLLGLDAIPWSFHQDEVVAYAEAVRFYEGPPISVFTTTWFGTSLPSLPFAFTGNLMHLLGASLGGVRAGVALVGALAVLPTYGLARLLWGRVAAAVAGLAWATSPVALHYSRISIVNITTATCWAACFYFLLHGLRTHRPMSFALAGLAGGLSMYTFYGTRLLPYLLVAFAVYLALFHFRTFREHLGHLGLVVVGFIVGFGPLAAYFAGYPDMWAGRGLSKLNVPPAIPTTWEALAHDWNVLAPLADRNLLSLSVRASADGFYWAPFLSPVEAVLLLLGVGVIASRWRQPGAFLVLLWGASVVFVGGTLIDRDHIPAFVHWTPAFPAFFLTLSLTVSLLFQTLLRYRPRWRHVGGGLLAAGLCVLAGANLYRYVAVYPSLVPPAFAPAEGRFLSTLPPDSLVRVVGNSSPPYSPEMGQLLAPGLAVAEILNPSLELPLPPGGGRDLVFIFNDDEAHYLPVVQSYYPGGEVRRLQTPGGPVGRAYLVPAGMSQGRQGVEVAIEGADGSVLHQGEVPAVGALPPELDVRYPVTATWSGALYVPQPGPITLSLEGSTQGQALLGGQPTGFGVPVFAEHGWRAFCLRVPLDGPGAVRLLVKGDSGAAREVDTARLWPQPCDAGLALTLGGYRAAHRVDPFVGAGVLSRDTFTLGGLIRKPSERDPEFVPLASDAGAPRLRWEGQVFAEGGRYRLELHTDGQAALSIDGAALLAACSKPLTVQSFFQRGGYPWVGAEVSLTPGWHAVHLDFAPTGTANGLEWRWTRPDGVTEIVPPNRLRHTVSFDLPPSAPVTLPGTIDCPPSP